MIGKPSNIASYTTSLLASGRLVFTGEEAQKAIGIGQGAFLDAAEKLQRRRRLLRPRRGFYVVVPPEYLNLGSPPPAWFIDDLMRHEGCAYYVGMLKAAELHGAAHQAAMVFQVIANKRIPAILRGRSSIAFYYRKDMAAVSAAIEEHKTETGKMKVSSAELTFLDLIRYPQASGGLDNVATVLGELGRKLDADKLALLSSAFERSVMQRAGYLLSRAGLGHHADRLHASLGAGSAVQWIELDPALAADPDLASPVVERDKRWRVIVRRPPEQDP